MPEQVTFDGEIDWYDFKVDFFYILDYNEEQFWDAVNALKLKVGDKIKITISKVE